MSKNQLQYDITDIIREILLNNLKISKINLEEDVLPLQASLQPFSKSEQKGEEENEEDWQLTPSTAKKRHSWDNISSTVFAPKPKYQIFKEAVQKFKKLDDHAAMYFHQLGKIFRDDKFTVFNNTETTSRAVGYFFNALYQIPAAHDIINIINETQENPKCLLFCVAKNTEVIPRCYVTLSGHFPSPDKVQKLNVILNAITKDLNNKQTDFLFQFRDNHCILDINTLYAGLHKFPSNADQFKQPCAEKTMTSFLAKKFFKYGYAMKVQGIAACHLKFYPPFSKKARFSLQFIQPCEKYCQHLTHNMLQIWSVAQLAGQSMIGYLRKKFFLAQEIRQFMECYAEKDPDFFHFINSKLNKKYPENKITGAHIFDSPDISSCGIEEIMSTTMRSTK